MDSDEWIEVLSQYNADRAKGFTHTPEWKEEMRILQHRFDEGIR